MVAYFLGGFGSGILITVGLYYWNIGRHKRMKSLTKYMIFSIGFVVIYTVVEFIVSTITGVSHDVLTGCVYSFFGGEIVICGLIKIFKLKEEGKNEDTNTGELSSRLDDLGGS